MQEIKVQSLEKETATHSSILAWRITWTEEPGRLRSMGFKESDMTKGLTLNFHFSSLVVYPECGIFLGDDCL